MTPPHSPESQQVLSAYAALNRNDIAGFLSLFDPDVVRIEFEGTPIGGTYRGIEAVKAHVVAGRGRWAEGACEPRRTLVARDKVIVFCHVHVRLKDETDWRDGDTFDVFTFRDGKVTEFRTFADERQAMEWVGAM